MSRPFKKEEDKKIKISITLDQKLNKRIDTDLTNKSRLIEKLVRDYYEKKDM
jgi:metal-responsive CopG/Arc/MetJ family transcriptional regulator